MQDIEKTLELLRQKGVTIADVYGKLHMERGYFDGRRRSVNEYKRRELAGQIMEAFPEYFQESAIEEPTTEYTNHALKDKYIQMLETSLKEAREDRDFLRHVIAEKDEQIRQLLQKK